MKKKLAILSTLMISVSCIYGQKTGPFTITGDVKNANWVYFFKDGRFGLITDSTQAQNGHFEFKGDADDISLAMISIQDDSKYGKDVNLILEAGNIKIDQSKDGNVFVKGTYSNNLIYKFENDPAIRDSSIAIAPIYEQDNAINERLFYIRKSDNPDQALIDRSVDSIAPLEQKIQEYWQFKRKKMLTFMEQNPKTYFTAAYMLMSGMNNDSDKSLVTRLYQNLGSEIQESKLGKILKKEIDGAVSLKAGIPAPTFAAKDVNGNLLSLADFKGKYVLLDFWATWCGPCRAGNPELIKIYNKYHSKGLEIIGIAADDNNIDGWKKAIKTDKIGIWHQVLEYGNTLDNGKSPNISSPYNVSAFPTQYLIDKEGNIVTKIDLQDLENKLAELMP